MLVHSSVHLDDSLRGPLPHPCEGERGLVSLTSRSPAGAFERRPAFARSWVADVDTVIGGCEAARVAASGDMTRRRNVGAELRVYDRLLVSPARTRNELAELCDLPLTTVVAAVNRLLEQGEIVELDPLRQNGRRQGRPARRLTIAGWNGEIATVLMSRSDLRVAIVSFDGTIRASAIRAFDPHVAADGFVEPAVAMLEEVLRKSGLGLEALISAVVGVPGPIKVGPSGRTMTPVLKGRDDLPAWMSRDPAAELRRAIDVACVAENDANLEAIGEAVFGAGAGLGSVIYVKVVTGVGAGVIIDDRLVRGVAGLAGEIFHLHVEDGDGRCACGRRGCRRRLSEAIQVIGVARSMGGEVTFADLASRSGASEHDLRVLIDDLGQTIGASLAGACVVMNPSAIILDPKLGSIGSAVCSGVRDLLTRQTPAPIANSIRVFSGSLGEDAEVLGAAALAGFPGGDFSKARRRASAAA